MKPVVSVIIPAYNVEKYIEKCIQSVLMQSYRQLQIIIINDGSQDSTGEIVERYAAQNPNIIYIDKENGGVANARNDGVKVATGEYLLFVDSDDYISETYIENMVRAAMDNESELVISGYTLVHQDERRIKEIVPDEYVPGEREEWAYRICSTWGRLYKRFFWEMNNLAFLQEDGARAEDVPIAMYANAMARNICVIPEPGYYYRQHDEAAMHKSGGYFRFPYEAFEMMYPGILKNGCINSLEFFLLGTVKLFAHFDFVIYRNAPKEERVVFKRFVSDFLSENTLTYQIWKEKRRSLRFPLLHKILMQILLVRYKGYRKW